MHLSKVCCIQHILVVAKYLTCSQPAMLFSILLINPISLFTNALPADGPLSSRTSPIQAQAVAFDLPLCPTANNSLYTAKVVTRDICTSLTTPSSINVKGYLSGAAANMNVDSKRFNCKISYYAGSECSGSPLGETAAIGPDAGLGPCVDFIFSSQGLSTLQLRANSALLTCKPT